jgi:hypothetical protein
VTAPATAHGATRVARKRSPLGWLPWLALLLAALLVLGAVLLALNVGDKGDSPGVDFRNDPTTTTP